MIDIIMMFVGLALLLVGGEALVRGSVSLARSFGISKLLVSALIIGFGTSMPEMTVSVGAALKGAPELALGNVIGSNIANIILITGFAAFLWPVSIQGALVRRETYVMLGASVILAALFFVQPIGFAWGLMLVGFLGAYIFYSYRQDRTKTLEDDGDDAPILPILRASLYCVGGLLFMVGGASLLVEGAILIARHFGISEAVIGLTIVAVGTSLPELVTAIIASLRKHSDIILGNVLGSNIFNILSILGVTAMVKPIPMTGQIAHFDIWFMLIISIVFAALLIRAKHITRPMGFVMLLTYIGYTVYLYMGAV